MFIEASLKIDNLLKCSSPDKGILNCGIFTQWDTICSIPIITDRCNNVDGPHSHYTEQKKPDGKKNIQGGIICLYEVLEQVKSIYRNRNQINGYGA